MKVVNAIYWQLHNKKELLYYHTGDECDTLEYLRLSFINSWIFSLCEEHSSGRIKVVLGHYRSREVRMDNARVDAFARNQMLHVVDTKFIYVAVIVNIMSSTQSRFSYSMNINSKKKIALLTTNCTSPRV